MGHFDGRLKNAVENAIEHAKDKAFYECLTRHGFYDVADTANGLKDWQRASVPDYNQNRMTSLAEAIAEMIQDVLANDEYGVLTTTMEDIVNKLDMRGSMTASEMDVVGGALGGLTGGTSEAARQAISSAVAAAMKGFKFDPDVIPPISLGLSGLPFSISNIYKPGTLAPNYDFLYEWETDKHDGFYEKDGKLMIGPGIPVDLGGPVKVLVLRTIFGVPNVEKECKPQGDLEGGLTMEEFQVIQKVMDMPPAVALDRDDVKEFKLSDKQMRSAFYRYIHFILWQPLSNQNNWGYLHWGVITNNACPEKLRTAICSFLRTNGLALDPAVNPDACMICHCLNAGMAYYVGRDTPVTLVSIPNANLTYWDSKKKEGGTVPASLRKAQQYPGVKKDKKLAYLHFTIIADILSRMTLGTSVNDVELRKRRVSEANLIYGMVGLPEIEYGKSPASLKSELTGKALEKRGLPDLMCDTTIYVFKNEADNLVAGGDVKIVLQDKKLDPDGDILQERSKKVMQYAGALAGIKVMPVSSLLRTAYEQGRIMGDNWHHGNRINYRGAQPVNEVYKADATAHPGPQPGYVSNERYNTYTRPAMIKKAKELYDKGVTLSLHTTDPTKVQAVDISYKWLENKYHYPHDQVVRLGHVFQELKKQGILKNYLQPDSFTPPPKKGTGEPAFHIEIYTSGPGSEIGLRLAEENPGAMSPTEENGQEVIMANRNFLSAATMDAPLVKDSVDSKKEEA